MAERSRGLAVATLAVTTLLAGMVLAPNARAHESKTVGEASGEEVVDVTDPVEMRRLTAEAIAQSSVEVADTEHALRILDHQDVAGVIVEGIRSEYPTRYAGLVHLGVGDQTLILIAGKDDGSLRTTQTDRVENVEFQFGFRYSQSEALNRASEVHNALMDSRAFDTVYTRPNLFEERIVILVAAPAEEAVSATRRARELASGVVDLSHGELDVSFIDSAKLKPDQEHSFGGGALLAGTQVNCTTGFGVKKNGSSTKGMLTAAHCNFATSGGPPGGPTPISQYAHQSGTPHGSLVDVGNGAPGPFGDFTWITIPGSETRKFYARPSVRFNVGSVKNYLSMGSGQWVCHFGRSTNHPNTQCNQVVDIGNSKNNTGNLVEVKPITSQGGDSGGPWFNGGVAWGIHEGRVPPGNTNSNRLFSSAQLAEIILDVTLLQQ